MKRLLRIAGWMLGVLVSASAAGAALHVQQEVSQTAVWPGDRFRYSITIEVPAGTQVALEDFDRKNVNFAPFVANDATTTTTATPSGATRYRFDYVLSNYETGSRSVELPRIVFRYQPVTPPGTTKPTTVEEAVPALPISVQSTLNQPLKDSWIEESLATPHTARSRWIAVVLGLIGLAVSSVPLWMWLHATLIAWRARREQPSWQQFLQRWAGSLDDLSRADGTDIKARFRSLEDLVDQYLIQACHCSLVGMTPAQLHATLEAIPVNPDVRAVLESAVDHAQHCRYAPPGEHGWEERFRDDVDGLRALAA